MCRFGTALLAVAVLCCNLTDATAQVNPYGQYNPAYYSGYYGYVINPYGFSPAGIMDAQARGKLTLQEADLKKEEVRKAKIENRKLELEQWLWERDHLPTVEDNRVRDRNEQIRRSQNDPPLGEIWSAKALNDLLDDLEKAKYPQTPTALVPLDQEQLQKLNVTSGKSDGNIGLLKSGHVKWPLLLQRTDFAANRRTLDGFVSRAVNQAASGNMDAEAIEGMIAGVTALDMKLADMASALRDRATWTPTMYMDSKHFLRQFDAALRVLQQSEDASNYLNGKYAAKGKTAIELVRYMKGKGLKFAPATPGTETAYTAVHRILADYDTEVGPKTLTKTAK